MVRADIQSRGFGLAIGIFGVMTSSQANSVVSRLGLAFPNVPIYFIRFANEENLEELHISVANLDIRILDLEGKHSNARARNALIDSVTEDFLLMIPAGWIPAEPVNKEFLSGLCELIERNEDWLLVAGNANQVEYSHLNVIREPLEPHSVALEQSRFTEIVGGRGEPREVIRCDFVTDFFLLSRGRLVQMGLYWDEKLDGLEHEDFLFQLLGCREEKKCGDVFFLPEFMATQAETSPQNQPLLFTAPAETLIAFSRKWQVSKIDRAKRRGGREITWLDRDSLWLEALRGLVNVLDREEMAWKLSGSSCQAAIGNGVFDSNASEIELELLTPRHRINLLMKSLNQSGFTLRQAEGNPRKVMRWKLDYPTPPSVEWRFGPVIVSLTLIISDKRKSGESSQSGYSGRRAHAMKTVQRLYVPAWQLSVNLPSTDRDGSPKRTLETPGLVAADYSSFPGVEANTNSGDPLGRLVNLFYLAGMHLRFSTLRFFLYRHPRINCGVEFSFRVYKFIRRRVVEGLERIEFPSFRGVFWSTRYRIRRILTKPAEIGQFTLDDFEIRWINLPERKLRKKQLLHEFNRLGFTNHRRFEAHFDNPGILGCATSHLAVLREERLTEPAVVVAEDDIEFLVSREQIDAVFNEFMSNQTLDVLCLGYNAFGPRIDVGETLQICKHINTASFYVVKSRAVDPLIKCFADSERHLRKGDPDWIYAQDQLWTRLQKGRLFFAIPRFQVLRQRPGYSSIQRANVNYGV